MLPGRPAAEVPAGHDNVPGLYVGGEGGVDVFHGMFAQLFEIGDVQVAGRDNHIRVHMVSVTPNLTHFITSLGSVIWPVMALAAAVSGLARYTSLSTWPIRPLKFRLVVETHRSPAARIPI